GYRRVAQSIRLQHAADAKSYSGTYLTSPALWAIAAASVRRPAPTLDNTRETWASTVRSLIHSASAILRLVAPAASRPSTSTSRVVSPYGRDGRDRTCSSSRIRARCADVARASRIGTAPSLLATAWASRSCSAASSRSLLARWAWAARHL